MKEQKKLSGRVVNPKYRNVLLWAIVILVLAALLDPGDKILHLKIPAFVAVLTIWINRRGLSHSISTLNVCMVNLGLAVVIPLIWTIIGLLNHNAHNGDIQLSLLKSSLFLLILPVLVSEDIDLASLIIRMGVLIAVLTFVMVAVQRISPTIFIVIYEFTMDKGNAMMTPSRDLLGAGIGMFYYKTSSLMIFPFSYHCNLLFQCGARWLSPALMSLLFGAALLISGTRANILAVLFVAAVFALGWICRTGGWLIALTVGILGIVLVAVIVIPKFADTKEQSNSIKIEDTRAYENEFARRPSALLWGEGSDSYFYSKAFPSGWTNITELTYVEMIRVFGLPMTGLFWGGLLWIACKLFMNGDLPVALAFMAYLFISATNPLLVSSTGLLVICAVWRQALKPSCPESMFYLPGLYPQRVEGNSCLANKYHKRSE